MMRLIDADALIPALGELKTIITGVMYSEDVVNTIINAPTIDAEPVKHSHWEVAIGYDPNKKVQCQNCFLVAHEPTSRCPHCGAKMDLEGE